MEAAVRLNFKTLRALPLQGRLDAFQGDVRVRSRRSAKRLEKEAWVMLRPHL